MTFRPDKLHVYGEIDVMLSNQHVVKGKIELNEAGEVQLTFADPDMVARWLMTTLDNKLVGLQIVTVTNEPTDHLEPPHGHIDDYLRDIDGEAVWFHKCRVEGSITLPGAQGSCPHCGAIQITRRKQP